MESSPDQGLIMWNIMFIQTALRSKTEQKHEKRTIKRKKNRDGNTALEQSAVKVFRGGD